MKKINIKWLLSILFLIVCVATSIAQKSKTINLSTAGTLSSALTKNEKDSVTDLSITGSIDARDFKTMRDSMPKLTMIDMSTVLITAYTGTLGTASTTSYPYASNSIPGYAFYNFTKGIGKISLTSITLPVSINTIQQSAFYRCSNLSQVYIHSNITSMTNAFSGCGQVNVDAANPNYSSVNGVLFNKTQTQLLHYPVTTIKTSYIIPSKVTTIESNAFTLGIDTIIISSNVSIIKSSGLDYINGLIYVDPTNSNFSSFNGVLYNKDQTILLKCPSSLIGYSIPQTVKTINDNAFLHCTNLKTLNIPESIDSIKYQAFYGCSSLTEITIPSSVKYIGNNSFYMCSKLSSILIPETISFIGSDLFAHCSALTSISLPSNTKTLNGYFFYYCTKLSSLYINSKLPPLVTNSITFQNVSKTTCTIYVPTGSKAFYQTAAYWKDFANIIEMPSLVKDFDGNVYDTVVIGNQVWMKQNLRTTHYNNGDSIGTTWPLNLGIANDATAKYQWAYEGKDSLADIYGRLYTWYAIMDSRGVCPTSFHIPSDSDWHNLVLYFDPLASLGSAVESNLAGNHIKESGTVHWASGNTSTNSSGFTALPGGVRWGYGAFVDISMYGNWWTSSEFDALYVWDRTLANLGTTIKRESKVKSAGFSVRCMKNLKTTAKFNSTIDSISKTVSLNDSSLNSTKFFWQLGNATVSTETNPIVTYQKGGYIRINETVVDTVNNVIDQTEKIIHINDGTDDCEADFIYSVNPADKTVQFVNQSLGTNLNNYLWNFGDTLTSSSTHPLHTYTKENYYSVCLTAASATCKNISCKTIKVGNSNKAHASFTYVPDRTTNLVYFNNTSKGGVKCSWNFGDGKTSVLDNPKHVYADTGLYHVILEVTDSNNNTTLTHNFVYVHSSIETLKAVFISTPFQTGTKGVLPIEFKGANYGDAAELEWDFGDGTTESSTMYPIHDYKEPGTYYVCLTVKDPVFEQEDTYCDSITITTVAINDATELSNQFDVYPNPAKSELIINNEKLKIKNGLNTSISITNTLGQDVFHSSFLIINSSLQIDVSQFSPGTYFLKLTTDNGVAVKKFVKQ